MCRGQDEVSSGGRDFRSEACPLLTGTHSIDFPGRGAYRACPPQPPPGKERGVTLGDPGREARAPAEEGNAGLRHSGLFMASPRLVRESPSQQERRGGLGAHGPREPGFYISAAELSCSLLLVPLTRPPPSPPPPPLLCCESQGRAYVLEAAVKASRKIPPERQELLFPRGLS